MNFLELKLIRRLATGIVSFTSFLVIILGLWLWGNVMAAPERADFKSQADRMMRAPTSVQAPILDATAPNSLEQASIATELKSTEKQGGKLETLTLDCLKDGQHIEKSSLARQVRLKSGLCLGHRADLEKSNVVNRANGFEATLFQLEKGGFSSDYINLVDGENHITIQLKDGKGAVVAAEVVISHPAKF